MSCINCGDVQRRCVNVRFIKRQTKTYRYTMYYAIQRGFLFRESKKTFDIFCKSDESVIASIRERFFFSLLIGSVLLNVYKRYSSSSVGVARSFESEKRNTKNE